MSAYWFDACREAREDYDKLRARVKAVYDRHRSGDDDESECGMWHECSILKELEAALNG